LESLLPSAGAGGGAQPSEPEKGSATRRRTGAEHAWSQIEPAACLSANWQTVHFIKTGRFDRSLPLAGAGSGPRHGRYLATAIGTRIESERAFGVSLIHVR